jgi:hypothetical protein
VSQYWGCARGIIWLLSFTSFNGQECCSHVLWVLILFANWKLRVDTVVSNAFLLKVPTLAERGNSLGFDLSSSGSSGVIHPSSRTQNPNFVLFHLEPRLKLFERGCHV